jgi:hypothetical protein
MVHQCLCQNAAGRVVGAQEEDVDGFVGHGTSLKNNINQRVKRWIG